MDTRRKFTFCRLCLCKSEVLMDIFQEDERLYTAAEVIIDLLQFHVSEDDGYSKFVCLRCFDKLSDFKVFKEQCMESKDTFEKEFVPALQFNSLKEECADGVLGEGDIDGGEAAEEGQGVICGQSEMDLSSPGNVEREDIVVEVDIYPQMPPSPANNDEDMRTEEEKVTAELHARDLSLHHGNSERLPNPYLKMMKKTEKPKKSNSRSRINSAASVKGENDAPPSKRSRKKQTPFKRPESRESWQEMLSRTGVDVVTCDQPGVGDADPEHWQKQGSVDPQGPKRPKNGPKLDPVKTERDNSQSNALPSSENAKEWNSGVKEERFNNSDDESSSQTPPPGGKIHRCDLCGKVFTRSSSLFRHKRIHTGEKPFICAECGKTFTQSGYLMQHMRVHSGDRRFACEECGKMFTDSGNLIQHRRVHTGEKPYGCNVCGMSFTQNGHLARHLKVHSGERPFQCEQCGKKFTNCSNLSRHVKLHADESVCGEFPS